MFSHFGAEPPQTRSCEEWEAAEDQDNFPIVTMQLGRESLERIDHIINN